MNTPDHNNHSGVIGGRTTARKAGAVANMGEL